MALSTPKPTSATLPEASPAPTATMASMTFQAIVNVSSHSARRCRRARSRVPAAAHHVELSLRLLSKFGQAPMV